MTTLPHHRVLYASQIDPSGDPAPHFEDDPGALTSFVDAIRAGNQLHRNSNGDELLLVEVCLTEFTDPVADSAIRFAVSMWNDPNDLDMGKHDFASYDEAYARYVYYVSELELNELLV